MYLEPCRSSAMELESVPASFSVNKNKLQCICFPGISLRNCFFWKLSSPPFITFVLKKTLICKTTNYQWRTGEASHWEQPFTDDPLYKCWCTIFLKKDSNLDISVGIFYEFVQTGNYHNISTSCSELSRHKDLINYNLGYNPYTFWASPAAWR